MNGTPRRDHFVSTFKRSSRLARALLAVAMVLAVAGALLSPGPARAAPASSTPSVGAVYAWGLNSNGQLGDGTATDQHTPVAVALPAGVTVLSVAAGASHSLAVGSDGNVYAWGANGNGQLGDGTITERHTPVAVALPAGVTARAVSAGYQHSLAVGSDGNIYAWGYNGFGQLGDGTIFNRHTPVAVALPAGVTARAVSGGVYHSLALGSNGTVYAWGYNLYGELGDGTTTQRFTPVAVTLPTAGVTVLSVSAGDAFSLAVGSDARVYAWGYNGDGELGVGGSTNQTTPVAVTLPAGVTVLSVSAGASHSLALGSDGNVYTWGTNTYGQLGNGTIFNRHTPVVATLPAGVTVLAVSAGFDHSLARVIPAPPTATPTNTPLPPTNTATNTATNTPVPTDTPTNTTTSTPVPPTTTSTPVPPTATNTSAPPTSTPTYTPAPPTDTPTSTPAPPTDTPTSRPVLAATIVITPTSGTPFQVITMNGSNFGANEAVKVFWDNTGTPPVGTSGATAGGAFVTTLTVPRARAGAHTLIAVGQTSGTSASATFNVKPKVFLSPASGKANSVAHLIGVGFGANETVAGLWSPGFKVLNSATSNVSGTVALSFTVPLSPTGSYAIIGYGLTTKVDAFTTFKVTALFTLQTTALTEGNATARWGERSCCAVTPRHRDVAPGAPLR